MDVVDVNPPGILASDMTLGIESLPRNKIKESCILVDMEWHTGTNMPTSRLFQDQEKENSYLV